MRKGTFLATIALLIAVAGAIVAFAAYFKRRSCALCDDYMSRRREKQPLEYPSAGSVFKRGNGFITAKLIEDAGLKGSTIGGAQVSEKHAGFIINRGGATASDVLRLIRHIQATVRDRFGADIECEVRYIPRG